ncbi:hypothetical protein JOF53_008595 [Crossiella equi]|uniref:Secreted protein n=1 Tax=Crossiella equi TaxID=130796 RepID=A0ABS5AT22_9PSEU|nr:hypothetical protein [Crossiella equi]MBP2479723.1 hypothetical protein [Crossiella equi]
MRWRSLAAALCLFSVASTLGALGTAQADPGEVAQPKNAMKSPALLLTQSPSRNSATGEAKKFFDRFASLSTPAKPEVTGENANTFEHEGASCTDGRSTRDGSLLAQCLKQVSSGRSDTSTRAIVPPPACDLSANNGGVPALDNRQVMCIWTEWQYVIYERNTGRVLGTAHINTADIVFLPGSGRGWSHYNTIGYHNATGIATAGTTILPKVDCAGDCTSRPMQYDQEAVHNGYVRDWHWAINSEAPNPMSGSTNIFSMGLVHSAVAGPGIRLTNPTTPIVRCDSGVAWGGTHGCRYPDYPGYYNGLSVSRPEVEEAAWHIHDAYNRLPGKPGPSLHPGRPVPRRRSAHPDDESATHPRQPQPGLPERSSATTAELRRVPDGFDLPRRSIGQAVLHPRH